MPTQAPCWLSQVFSVAHLRNCDYAAVIAQTIAGDKQSRTEAMQATNRSSQLVGRETILGLLRTAALQAIQAQENGFVLITGDAGFGKTRLLQHILDCEELQGYRSRFHVCMASCAPELSPMPLTPWRIIIEVHCCNTPD